MHTPIHSYIDNITNTYIQTRSHGTVTRMLDPPQMETYIIAVLLQREVVELLVPIQSLAALTLMYHFNPRASDLVHSWDEDAYRQAMWYVGVDVAIWRPLRCSRCSS